MKNSHRSFGIAATIIVLVALVWGFAVVGSPFTGRLERFDERRLQDLQIINSEILAIVYGNRIGGPDAVPARSLPSALPEVLQNAIHQRPQITDPQTGIPYEYRITDASHYELCATFAFPRIQSYDIFWDHPAGRSCYEFDVREPQGHGKPVPIGQFSPPPLGEGSGDRAVLQQ
ncbi:hypothetical protein HY285_05360 [Candidatus Peregrinibacteria bacterium]|nr:hypothetical protein [Candidatus Peregrinibacteria bacterium]